jgi:hypothetical protein
MGSANRFPWDRLGQTDIRFYIYRYVDVFLNASVVLYMFLYLYDLFHILQPFLTYNGSRECNVCMYVCMYVCFNLNNH